VGTRRLGAEAWTNEAVGQTDLLYRRFTDVLGRGSQGLEPSGPGGLLFAKAEVRTSGIRKP